MEIYLSDIHKVILNTFISNKLYVSNNNFSFIQGGYKYWFPPYMGMYIALTLCYTFPPTTWEGWEGNTVLVQYTCPYKEGTNIYDHPVTISGVVSVNRSARYLDGWYISKHGTSIAGISVSTVYR